MTKAELIKVARSLGLPVLKKSVDQLEREISASLQKMNDVIGKSEVKVEVAEKGRILLGKHPITRELIWSK